MREKRERRERNEGTKGTFTDAMMNESLMIKVDGSDGVNDRSKENGRTTQQRQRGAQQQGRSQQPNGGQRRSSASARVSSKKSPPPSARVDGFVCCSFLFVVFLPSKVTTLPPRRAGSCARALGSTAGRLSTPVISLAFSPMTRGKWRSSQFHAGWLAGHSLSPSLLIALIFPGSSSLRHHSSTTLDSGSDGRE
jgi:hypothetical protein